MGRFLRVEDRLRTVSFFLNKAGNGGVLCMCLIDLRSNLIRQSCAIHLHGISTRRATSAHADTGERIACLVPLAR